MVIGKESFSRVSLPPQVPNTFPESLLHPQCGGQILGEREELGAQKAWITSAHLTVFAPRRVLMGRGCWKSGVTSTRLSVPQATLEVLRKVQRVLPQFLGLIWPGRSGALADP